MMSLSETNLTAIASVLRWEAKERLQRYFSHCNHTGAPASPLDWFCNPSAEMGGDGGGLCHNHAVAAFSENLSN
jgi:hypothetical protein